MVKTVRLILLATVGFLGCRGIQDKSTRTRYIAQAAGHIRICAVGRSGGAHRDRSQFSWSVRSSSGPASLFSTHIHVASAAPAPGLPQTARHPGALFLCVYSHRQETASKHYFQAECPGRSVPVFKAWSRGGRG